MIKKSIIHKVTRISLHWGHYLALAVAGLFVAFGLVYVFFPATSQQRAVDVEPIQITNEQGILTPRVSLGGKITVDVLIAQTAEQKMRGLGYRDSLPSWQGMLFPSFDNTEPIFWMKGMNFDIDIIWIKDNEVVDIDTNVSHLDQTALYRPITSANMVLEINAGLAEKYGVSVGDYVGFHNIIFK
ncbi:DUF192 domain-containing protein [Candidatus Falkowbacteria bacterium]|nr:DUF192 domain-containing protein [Candidatus Falkowbacteria bacterium]